MQGQDEYWANAKIEDIADKVKKKFEDYKGWLETSGYGDRIKTSYQRFYTIDKQGGFKVRRDQDDIARIDVNHFKSLIKRMHIIVTENKLAYQPTSQNSDSTSQIKADIGRGICDYYGEEKNMNGVLSEAVLNAIIMFEWYIHSPWSIAEGYELSTDGNQIVKTGDQKFEGLSAFNCAHSTVFDKSPWYIIRAKVNKYDEATLHPEFHDEIVQSSIDTDVFDRNYRAFGAETMNADDKDSTHKYILYHERTPAIPEGKWVEICGGQVLRYGPLVYSSMPVAQLRPGSITDTVFADSPAIDLLGVQEAMNALFSGVVTNGLNNAVGLIWSPDTNLSITTLDDGQKHVCSTVKPEGINLTNTSGDTYKLIDMLLNHGQLLSGINDTARGNPSSNLKSGSSLAIVLVQAIQYVSALQKSYARVAGEVGTSLLRNCQIFGPDELIGYIAGVSREGQVKKFKKQDIMDIDRVAVNMGNPLMQTMAGRMEFAESWTQKGIMKDPKQIESFLRTGELDSVTEDDFNDAVLIKSENEQLKRGINPPVLLLDSHPAHMVKHRAVISSPEAREDPRIMDATLSHMQEHIRQLRLVPPDIAAVISGQPLPQEMPQGGPAGGPAGGPEQPQVNGARMPSMPPGSPPGAQAAYQQSLDQMPPEQGPMQ